MNAWQATCILGALAFTGMIHQVGGNTPLATVAAVSAETPAAPTLSVPEASPRAGTALGAELGSAPAAVSAPSMVAKAEVGDAFIETKSVNLGRPDGAQTAPTTPGASDDAAKAAPVTQDFRYLIYYVWSELPPAEKPADIVLRSLKDVPVGTPVEEIKRASDAFGLDFNYMKAVARIESNFDPKQRTGSYIGLFQLSKYEFNKFGSGQIRNPRDNAVAAAYKIITEGILFEWVTHRKPTLSDLYLIHQQGWEGAAEHISHPDRIAWKSMCATSEGIEKGEKWCRRAIWRNTVPAVKHAWKSVDKLTSGAFVEMWRERVAHFYSKYAAIAAVEPGNP
jgi:Transglycosylase SLT domain